MNRLVETEIKTKLPEDFQLGINYPEPVVMEEGAVLLINENIHIAVITSGGKLERILRPVQTTFIDNTSLPIFREASGNAIAFYPGSNAIFFFDLEADDNTCQEAVISDLKFRSHALGTEKDEEVTDYDFYYEASIRRFYFILTIYDKVTDVLLNRLYSLEEADEMQQVATLLETSESANRPIVHQPKEGILFGLSKNCEMIVRIEMVGRSPLRIRIDNFDSYRRGGKLLNRMVSSVGMVNLEGKKYVMILFNDEHMIAGAQFLDISEMRSREEMVEVNQYHPSTAM